MVTNAKRYCIIVTLYMYGYLISKVHITCGTALQDVVLPDVVSLRTITCRFLFVTILFFSLIQNLCILRTCIGNFLMLCVSIKYYRKLWRIEVHVAYCLGQLYIFVKIEAFAFS